jgi:NIPSNAP
VAHYQLREYTIKPGEIEQWIDEWRTKIVPLRRRFGFEVVGAWTVAGTDRFIWVIRYDGPRPWEEADTEYYESAERKALSPDPARHMALAETRMMVSVL